MARGGNTNDDELASYFEKSAAAVRQYSDRFERTYGRPAVNYGMMSFQAHPVLSTFVTLFGLLSFLPFLAFIGSSLLVIFSILFVTLSFAFAIILAIEVFFVSILLFTLTGTFALALFLTFLTVSTYFFVRLLLLVRTEGGRNGVVEWVGEVQGTLIGEKGWREQFSSPRKWAGRGNGIDKGLTEKAGGSQREEKQVEG